METNLATLPIGEGAPRLVNAVVEVPVGSRNKYEYEPELGVLVRDRVLPGAVRYPTDYGFVPSTLTDRGDALDIVVAAYDPAFPGCVGRARPVGAPGPTAPRGRAPPAPGCGWRARPVGALPRTAPKGEEHNVLAVPDDDPRFADIGALGDLPGESPARTCARSSSSSRSTSGWRATRKSRSLAGWAWMRRTS